jgi:hypothetical protein
VPAVLVLAVLVLVPDVEEHLGVLLPRARLQLQVFPQLLVLAQGAHSAVLQLLPQLQLPGCTCTCSMERRRIRHPPRPLRLHRVQERPADSGRLRAVAPVVRHRHRLRLPGRW